MAADDEYDKLLREVDAALGGAKAAPKGRDDRPVRRAAVPPAAAGGQAAADERRPGTLARLRSGTPRAVTVGAGWGVVVGGAFTVLPFLHGISGALGAFVAATGVCLAGRIRSRR